MMQLRGRRENIIVKEANREVNSLFISEKEIRNYQVTVIVQKASSNGHIPLIPESSPGALLRERTHNRH
jgi:hypothetical protein